MITHGSQSSTDKNNEKKGPYIGEEPVTSKAPESAGNPAADGVGSAAAADEGLKHTVRQRTQKLLLDARGLVGPLGRWADKQSLAHPFLTVVTSAGAGALAGALVRRTMAVRAGLTVGLLTALYLRRKYSHAAPVGAGSGAT